MIISRFTPHISGSYVPPSRYYTNGNGAIYGQLNSGIYLSGDWFFTGKSLVTASSSGEMFSATIQNDSIIMDYTSGNVRVFSYVGSTIIGSPVQVAAPINTVLDISFSVSGDIGTLTVNGSSSTGSGWSTLNGSQCVTLLYTRSMTSFHSGYNWDFNFNGQNRYPLDEAFGSEIIYDNIGAINGTWHNRTSNDVTTVEPS